MTSPIDLATAWLAVDPDPETRAEMSELIAHGDEAELAARFAGRLEFGTAGLRGPIGAGPTRMNRVVVRRAAWGLVQHLLEHDPDAAAKGIVIGCDARKNSDVFALDTARVAAAMSVRAMLLPEHIPTPLLASSILSLGAAAGVMVTASHNPPADNGYKVYLGDGAQIVPPHDVGISAWIDRAPADVPVAAEDHPLIGHLDDEPLQAYLSTISPVSGSPGVSDVVVAYSPLHGVAGRPLLAAFDRAGLPTPEVVTEQFEPDPTFRTVTFPNPEEPGTMDLLIALAERVGADVAIANDPDGDRLGAAIVGHDGRWRKLTGDELGCLLADHLLRSTAQLGPDRLVVTTLVSSTLLSKMAAAAGVQYAETSTGFKWIARAILDHPELTFVMGYEQALGYLVRPTPLDKDGITAAVLLAEIAATAKAQGRALVDLLDDLVARFGRHVTSERSVRMLPAAGVAAVEALRVTPPTHLAGHEITSVQWFDDAGLLRLHCGADTRVQVRPSGTEPKVKVYGEAVGESPAELVDALAALLLAGVAES